MKQNCFSLRPGTLLEYKGQTWRVIWNDTINQRFQIKRIEPGTHGTTKTFRYRPGQEISITWKPDERI